MRPEIGWTFVVAPVFPATPKVQKAQAAKKKPARAAPNEFRLELPRPILDEISADVQPRRQRPEKAHE
jgi:hypothetical protein